MALSFLKKYWVYPALCILLYFPLFQSLDALTIRTWDESSVAVNSLCMYENKNYIVIYHFTEPEMWQLKPPLLNWLQNICFHIVGANELGIRLPVAIAAFFTCIALFVFFKKHLHQNAVGFLTAIILVSSSGYVSIHGSRTGDYDVLLTFFSFLYCLLFYLYCNTGKRLYLFLTFIALSFACLTKSAAALFFIPALFIYALYTRKLWDIFKSKETYLGLASFILLVPGFFLLRDHFNPGYLSAALHEIFAIASAPTPDHNEVWSFYFRNLIFGPRYYFWIYFLPLGILSVFFQKNILLKRFNAFAFLVTGINLAVISLSKYKCEWYDMQLFPWLAIIAAIGILTCYEIIISKIASSKPKQILFITVLILLTYIPYRNILSFTYKPKDDWSAESASPLTYHLRACLKTPHALDNYLYLFGGYSEHIYFYIKKLQQEGSTVSIQNYFIPLPENTKVFIFDTKVKNFIRENYDYSIDNTVDNVEFITLKKFKGKS